METKERTDNALRAAFDYLRRSRKTVLQTIADSVNCSRRHLQAALSPTENKPMGGKLAHKIAEFYSLDYGQFLELGERILAGEEGGAALADIRGRLVPARQELHLLYRGDAPAPSSNVEPATLPERSPLEAEFGASAPGPGFAAVPKAAARLSAGGGSFVVEGVSGRYHFRADWLNRLCNPAMAVLFDCVGDSMEPTIRGGETLLVDRSRTEIEDGGIYALGVGDTVMVKRLRRTPDGLVRIISDNRDAYPEAPPARPDEIRILGRVIWHGGEVK